MNKEAMSEALRIVEEALEPSCFDRTCAEYVVKENEGDIHHDSKIWWEETRVSLRWSGFYKGRKYGLTHLVLSESHLPIVAQRVALHVKMTSDELSQGSVSS